MYLDSSRLILPRNEQDLYSAHEVAQLKPLLNRKHTYELFLKSNLWAKQYMPHAFFASKKVKADKNGWGSAVVFVETMAKWLQLRHMQKRLTNEIIGDKLLRFHPVDARERVMGEYQSRIKKFFSRQVPS